MPGTDLPLESLKTYAGSYPCPADFVQFWRNVKIGIDRMQIAPAMERLASENPNAEHYRITVKAEDGILLRAKYIRPADREKHPCVLTFHDYPGASRGWFHLTRYAAIGASVLAPDCRGQGGRSESGRIGPGPAAYGPLFNGMEGGIKDLYLFRLFQDAMIWAKAALMLDQTDPNALSVCGDGQGGGLAIACSAMFPEFGKCAAHYPMLCDYKRVWDKDFDVNAYEGLRYFFRWHDPLHEREKEVFDKLAYVDVKNFAPLVRAKVLMSTGLQDMVSPPSAQFAVFNGLRTEKKHLVYPKHGHELNNFYANELLKFLLA